MLQTLSIKNVALITKLDIEFGKGLNVLLGETGAGKSIIFDALNFVLGSKADKTLIRSGENEMRVDALFNELSVATLNNLKEIGIEDDEVCISRTFNIEGKSNIRVNGSPFSQSMLRELGHYLLDSYSQHESVELLKSKNHLLMLDRFGGDEILNLKEEVSEKYKSYIEIKNKIKNLGGNDFERERKKSILEYQIKEIEDAKLKEGEDEELSNQLNLFSSAEKIFEAVSLCENLLSEGNSSCVNALQQSSSALSGLYFEEIEDCKKRLDSVRYEIEDISETLSSVKDSVNFDEREFERIDKRHDLIKDIVKKYGGSITKTIEFLEKAKTEFNELEDSQYLIVKYQKEENQALKELEITASKLSFLRKQKALQLEQKILNELRDLGMKSSQFEVEFNKLEMATINGYDEVEFAFSANKGQDVKSLAKTASGGELSRFMLAIKNTFAEIEGIETLVFDEIDTGISGETGRIVGIKLNNIASFGQILCITHLPQVASFGDQFFYVYKEEINNKTQTGIKNLKDQEIVENLAKMVVGEQLTETALKQAKEMREKSGKGV